jgi:hypothetical protein
LGAGDARHDRRHVAAQCVHVRGVRFATRPDGHVGGGSFAECRQELETDELAQPALESVAIDGGLLVSRNHNPNARVSERGSECPDIEVHGPNPLPLSNNGL